MAYSALKKEKYFFLSDKNLAMMTENYMYKQTQNHCLQLFSWNQFLMIQGKYVIQCIENTLLRLLCYAWKRQFFFCLQTLLVTTHIVT